MLHQLKHYLIHTWKSFHLHGIHSPFAFEFNRDCLQDDRDYSGYLEVVRFRESVKNNQQQLTIEDHGAGSKVLKENSRHSSQILAHNCSTLARTKLLYRIATFFNVENALELGTSLGTSTAALAMAAQKVTTVEGSPAVANYAKERLEENAIENVILIKGTFKDYFASKLNHQPTGKYDLIFIDGHHDGNATLEYFEQLLPYCNEETVIIVDDIHWSSDMTQAWKKLIVNPQVTASVNTFQWGILFLRKQQRQQSFYVKL